MVGDQELPQVVRGPAVRVGVEGIVGGGQVTGGQLGQQRGAGALAQPVQRRAWCVGGDDGLVDAGELGRELVGVAAQQLGGAPAQRARCAAAAFVELVLGPAVAADVPAQVGGGQPGAPGACLLYTSPSPRDRS